MTDRELAEHLEILLRIVLRILWQEGYTTLLRRGAWGVAEGRPSDGAPTVMLF